MMTMFGLDSRKGMGVKEVRLCWETFYLEDQHPLLVGCWVASWMWTDDSILVGFQFKSTDQEILKIDFI